MNQLKFAEWLAYHRWVLVNYQEGIGTWENLEHGTSTTKELYKVFRFQNKKKPAIGKGAHKLVKDDIKIIFTMYCKGMNHHEIAREFTSIRQHKISRRHVSSILQGKRWKTQINHLKRQMTGTK
jgi:hypothetical protein